MTGTRGITAVVTGAGAGIGRALALELAARGCRLAISDIDGERLAATARDCERQGADVLTGVFDVADPAAFDAHAADVVDQFGSVDLVVNNAGIAAAAAATEQPEEDVRRVLDVNLWGVINGSRAFLPHLIASGGHLVNLSSLFGLMTVPLHSAYCASKFAIRGYTEALATEMTAAGHPVRVSCVHPGGVATRIAERALITENQDREELIELFGRLARLSPEQAASRILRGVERDRMRIVVGAEAKALHVLVRLLGGRMPKAVARFAPRKLAQGARSASAPSSGAPAARSTDSPASRSRRTS